MVGTPIGLILHERGDPAEDMLAEFAFGLRAQGIDAGGLVQRSTAGTGRKSIMHLIDLRTGDEYRISQDLGPGSGACALDPTGLAAASHVLRREIAANVPLLVVNKFSGAEAEGGGLLTETFEAITHGIPLLTCLSLRYRDHWNALTDHAGTEIPPNPNAIAAWWASLG